MAATSRRVIRDALKTRGNACAIDRRPTPPLVARRGASESTSGGRVPGARRRPPTAGLPAASRAACTLPFVQIIDRGSGDPVVVIPGIQGRWPYVGITVDALAATHRVLTFSLAGEPDGRPYDPARGLDNFSDDLDALFEAERLSSAVLVGVSFGGVVALRYAAAHPSRVRALVLVSAPGPGWAPEPRQQWYMRAPRVFGLLFLLEAPLRVGPEIRAALPAWRDRAVFSMRQVATFAAAPFSFTRLAARAALAAAADTTQDAARITAPTLIVTGEPELDRVVPVEGTRQYARLIPGARAMTMAGTGHLGSLTQASRFATIVSSFIEGLHDAAA